MTSTSLRATVADAFAGVLALLLPISCAGCGEPDLGLCESCRAALVPSVSCHTLQACGKDLVVWSGLDFDGVAARVVRVLKADARVMLARSLAPALASAVQRAGVGCGDVLVVPIPTSRAAFRRRGFRVVEEVARVAGVPVRRRLRAVTVVSDQRGLGRAERRANVAGSLHARGVAGRRVIVIDDVVTTGATLGEAVRALREAGADVIGAATIAATRRRSAVRPTSFDTSETRT